MNAVMVNDSDFLDEIPVASEKKVMLPKTAQSLTLGTIRWQRNIGVFTAKRQEAYETSLAGTKTVEEAFSLQVSALYAALELARELAAKNLDRLGKILNTQKYLADSKTKIEKALNSAETRLAVPHHTKLPGDEGYEFQRLEKSDREAIKALIVELWGYAKVATCKNDMRHLTAFSQKGYAFTSCQECREKELAQQKQEEEGRLMKIKQTALMVPELAFHGLDMAVATWTKNHVASGRTKAKLAIDHEFHTLISGLAVELTRLWEEVPVGDLAPENETRVSDLISRIQEATAQVVRFEHKTWCRCGVPTFLWVRRDDNKLMEPGTRCNDCRKAKKLENATTAKTEEISTDALEAFGENPADFAGITVTDAEGKVVAQGSEEPYYAEEIEVKTKGRGKGSLSKAERRRVERAEREAAME